MSISNFGISGETTNQIDNRVRKSSRLKRQVRHCNVVFVTTGGNDLLSFLKNNIMVSKQTELSQRYNVYLMQYQKKITNLLKDIRSLNSKAPVFVFGIYNPVYVYFPQVSFISWSVSTQNVSTQNIVESQSKMHFVSIDSQLSHGQFQSKAAQNSLLKKSHQLNSKDINPNILQSILNGNFNYSNN